MDGNDTALGLETFVEQRKRKLDQITQVLEARQRNKQETRQRRNASIKRHSPGTSVEVGDLLLVSVSEYMLHRNGQHQKLAHKKWTDPWEVTCIPIHGIGAEVSMQGRKLRHKNYAMRPSQPRPLNRSISVDLN